MSHEIQRGHLSERVEININLHTVCIELQCNRPAVFQGKWTNQNCSLGVYYFVFAIETVLSHGRWPCRDVGSA